MESKDIGAYILYADGTVIKKSTGKLHGGRIPNSDGYPLICIYGKQVKLHRLIASHFLPMEPDKPTVNHKNGIKTDNRVENLEWCSHADNMRHGMRTGLIPPLRGSSNGRSILTEAQIIEIREALKTPRRGLQTRLAEKYNVHISTIHLIKKGRNWKHFQPT